MWTAAEIRSHDFRSKRPLGPMEILASHHLFLVSNKPMVQCQATVILPIAKEDGCAGFHFPAGWLQKLTLSFGSAEFGRRSHVA